MIDMLYGGGADDHAAYAASLPLEHEPGTDYVYSSGTTNIVSRMLGDAIGLAGLAPAVRAERYEAWLRERLFGRLDMASAAPKFDGAGNFVGSSYVYATARDFLKFGQLYLDDGVLRSGERLLPEGWVAHGVTARSEVEDRFESYGSHWWPYETCPHGSYRASGFEGQSLLVVPGLQLVAVRLGKTDDEHYAELFAQLAAVVDAFAS